jgi:hypothetical protein
MTMSSGQVHTVKKSKRIYWIKWDIRNKLQSHSPLDVALTLKKNLKPHGYIKHYKKTSGDTLELTKMD